MKNKLLIGGIVTTVLFSNVPVVDAMGNATVEFTGNNDITVGETFTIRMNVTNIKDTYDGVVSLGGNLTFDDTKLEYVSSKGVETPYLFQINEKASYKIAGLDFTLDNGIRETLTVYEFTFKALAEGNTTITLTNVKLTDSKDYINTTVLSKEIMISEKEEEIIEEIVEKDDKTEVKEDKAEQKEEIVITETKAETKEEPKIENVVVKVKEEVKDTKVESEVIETEETEEINNEVESIEVEETNEKASTNNETIFTKINKFINDFLKNVFKIFK